MPDSPSTALRSERAGMTAQNLMVNSLTQGR